MSQTIKLKRSSVVGKVPTTGNLDLGEIALNTNDGKVFFKKDDGTQSVQTIVTTDSLTTGSIIVSGSTEVTGSSSVTGSFSLNGYSLPEIDGGDGQVIMTDGDGTLVFNDITGILPSGTVSASAQLTNTFLEITGDSVVSSSAQIDHDQTTNFVAGEHFLQSEITTLGTVTSGNVTAILPSGVVSSSVITELPSGVVSSSAQTVANLSNQDVDFGTGDVTATTGSFDIVGIGTTSPSQTLTVEGNISSSGDFIIRKNQPTIRLVDNNIATSNFPRIILDTNNNQGVMLYHDEFDSFLPESGYGLILGPSPNNTQYPTPSGLTFQVLGSIYADTGTTGSGYKVLTTNDGLSKTGDSVVSSSAEGDGQGQIKLNGVNVNTNGLGTDDSPQFTNLILSGDLTVNGTTTTVNSTEVEIGDRVIALNTADGAGDAGLYVHDTSTNQTGSLLWDSSGDFWKGGLTGSEARFLTVDDEGSGNGLDADTVDGIQGSSFLRSDTSDTATGPITFSNSAYNSHIKLARGSNNGAITLGSDGILVSANSDASNYLFVSSSGNVGIGTSSPSSTLHLRNSGSASSLFFDTTATSDTDNRIASLRSSGAAYSSLLYDANTHKFRIGTSEKMRIDSNGNVGIGTDNPAITTAKLTVGGELTNTANLALQLYKTGTPQILSGDVLGNIWFVGVDNDITTGVNNIGARISAVATTNWTTDGTTSNTALTFHTHGTASGDAPERMRIDSSGKVGIGETNPTATLNIKSASSNNSDNLAQVLTNSEFRLQYRSDDLSSLYIGGLGSERGYLQ